MRKRSRFVAFAAVVAVVVAGFGAVALSGWSLAQQQNRPAYVIVERLATTGDESIQEEYAKRARDILPRYGGRYLARSQRNTQLEGDGAAPCCIAILEFPDPDAAKRWYDSPENQAASKIRQSGAKFRLVEIEGLSDAK